MTTMLIIIHVLVCVFLTLVVLLQQGAKQGMGAAFGGGGSATVFGGRGANTFLAKLTAGAAGLFMVTSLALSYLSSPRGVMDDPASNDGTVKVVGEKDAPAEGAAAPAAEKKDEGAAAPAAPAAPADPAPATK
jgi:preprotein translocase subunit SecG